MGEILYRPINDENERHLVQSRENPGRFRGQTRDKDNKNPDIIEWEPVEVPDYEYELKKLAHDERMAEIQARQSAADKVTSILNLIDTVVTFVGEHPEVVASTVSAAKQGITNVKNKLVTVAKDGKENTKGLVKKVLHKPKTSDTQIAAKARNEIIKEVSETSQVERENMSIEEARELILEILLDYISMKKKLNRFSNANIQNVEIRELDVNGVIAQLDSLIKEYPALMDKSTTENISALLKMNSGWQENAKIKEALRIDGLL